MMMQAGRASPVTVRICALSSTRCDNAAAERSSLALISTGR
jgi:hypothetical protein